MLKVELFKRHLVAELPDYSIKVEPFKDGSYPVTVRQEEYLAEVLVTPDVFGKYATIARVIEQAFQYAQRRN